MSRNTAHRMHGDGAANHGLMFFALPVSPWLVDNNLFSKGGISQVCGKLANTGCGNANFTRHSIWGISINHIGFRHQHKDRGCHTTRAQGNLTMHGDTYIFCFVRNHSTSEAVYNLGFSNSIPEKQTIIRGTRIADDKPGCICVPSEVININIARPH